MEAGAASRPSLVSRNTNAATAPAIATASAAVRIGPLPFFLRRGSFRGRSISRNGVTLPAYMLALSASGLSIVPKSPGISMRLLRALSNLLSMKLIERHCKQGGREHVENHHIDIRVSFD